VNVKHQLSPPSAGQLELAEHTRYPAFGFGFGYKALALYRGGSLKLSTSSPRRTVAGPMARAVWEYTRVVMVFTLEWGGGHTAMSALR